jgi:hypothetical protein
MFIHFYAHDILIFVLNYDKNSLNNNVPNDTLCHWPKCECIQLNFPSKAFFAICLNFQQQYPLTILLYCSHFRSQNYEINFIKSNLVRAF